MFSQLVWLVAAGLDSADSIVLTARSPLTLTQCLTSGCSRYLEAAAGQISSQATSEIYQHFLVTF